MNDIHNLKQISQMEKDLYVTLTTFKSCLKANIINLNLQSEKEGREVG